MLMHCCYHLGCAGSALIRTSIRHWRVGGRGDLFGVRCVGQVVAAEDDLMLGLNLADTVDYLVDRLDTWQEMFRRRRKVVGLLLEDEGR